MGFLLTKPSVILSIILVLIGLLGGLYFWWSQHEIATLNQVVAQNKIELSQQATTIKEQNDRMVLLQQLNDNFQKSVLDIRTKSLKQEQELAAILKQKTTQDPHLAEQFINDRQNQIFKDLTNLSNPQETKP